MDTLTGIRGFAALWVVLYHLFPTFLKAYPSQELANFLIQFGYLGVDLFSFLSGYVMAYVYVEQLSKASPALVRRFLRKRFTRTYPLHFFCLSLLVILFMAQHGFGLWRNIIQDTSLWKQIFLVNGLGTESLWKWNVPSWSLSAEWLCYVLFPVFAPLFFRIKRGPSALLAIVVVLAATYMSLHSLGHGMMDAQLSWGALRIGGEFAVGCLLFQLHQSQMISSPYIGWVGLVMIPLSVLCLVYMQPALAVLCFSVLVFCLASNQKPLDKLFGNRVSVYLGEISYSIYMLHWVVLINMGLFRTERLPLTWRVPVLLLIILSLSALSHRFVEVLAQRKLNSYFSRNEETSSKPS